jgi:membrane-associated protein
MDLIKQGIDVFLHLDVHLSSWSAQLGIWVYLVLFVIIFCETGLVVTPILPGDSLLFAAGALAALPGANLNAWLLMVILIVAAIAGDAVNYVIGFRVGPKVFASERSSFFNKRHLMRTHEFYEKYGGKTIVLARFIPIIRTFAPFVAGIAQMPYRRFSLFNFSGGIAWVATFLLGGYYFGNTETVKNNFHYVIVAIIIISVMPAVIEYFLARRRKVPSTQANPMTVESK